jgi:hypothetical protein
VTPWAATAVFLEINGVPAAKVSNVNVFDLVSWVAGTSPELASVRDRLARLLPE